MKKLIFLTTRLPYPTTSGRKVSLYHMCKGLHELYGYDIYLYSFLENGQTSALVEEKPDFIREIRLAKPISKLRKLWNLLTKALITGEPFQNALYFSPENQKALQEYCEEISPDAVMVDMIRLAPYYGAFAALSVPKILDLDDLLSKRYARQARAKEVKGDLFGAFSSGKAKGLLRFGSVKRAVLRAESRRTARAEQKYGAMYDRAVFVSETETAAFNRLFPDEPKALTVRLGVDYPYFSAGETPQTESGAICFLGNLRYAPNLDSLDILVKEILPLLRFPYRLYVIGPVSEDILSRYQNENIVFTGIVEDLRPAVKKCEVFLAPIAYGTGVKTKVLEALAMGVPVVTNALGAEGIDAENGKHLFIEDDAAAFAERVSLLHDTEALRHELCENGQRLIEEHYSWDKIYPVLKELGL